MANKKELETIISIAGRVEASLKKSIKDVSGELERMQQAVKESATATDRLGMTIRDQASDLDAAKRKYMDYVLSGEKGTKQAKELKKKIQQLSGELGDNKDRMKAAEIAADKLTGGLDDVGDAARDSKDGIGTMDIALGNLVANGISAVVSKAKDAATSILGLAESTREYREDLNKLETAYETAGHSTKAGTKVYKELFSVFGEEDRAVEAAQQIAKLADNEKEMSRMTEIATGAWAMWGDSLATESLMEAMNSTAKIGTVQGTLADALEWCGINLDTFNEALEGMNSEEERSAFILDTLDGLYSKSAANYKENNASIIEARKAQSNYNDTLAAMGEKIEPATTAVQNGLNKILTKALEVMDRIDFSKVAEQIGTLTDKAIDLATNGIGWLKDNMDWLVPVVGGLTAAFAAYKVISGAVAVYEGIKTAALASGTVVTGLASAATWTLGSAMAFLTSPIMLVVAAIAAVVAGGIALYRNWDTVKAKAAELGAWLSEKWTAIKTSLSNAWTSIQAKTSATWASITTSLSTAWTNIKARASEMVANVKAKISSGFSALKSIMMRPFQSVIDVIDKVKNKIGSITEKAKGIGSNLLNKAKSLIPGFASGGFTNGLSFAGEAGTEAVISFDRRYREENLGYWAQAGRMLNADFSDFALSGSSGGDYYDMGGVVFSPQITIHGHADKQTVMEAIEAEYPEFIDFLEEWFEGRGKPIYA